MADSLIINTYSRRTAATVNGLIQKTIKGSWLVNYSDQIFQVCDELIKNAVKSNYKFLLLWHASRKRMMEHNPDMSQQDADEWLREVFFSGESVLLEKQFEKIPDREQFGGTVRRLLDIENRYLELKVQNFGSHRPVIWEKVFFPLLRIKKLARSLKIHIHFRIETSSDQVLITVSNDAPILEEDMMRIASVRGKFAEYCKEDRQQDFFVENLDTSGGGHGLGYAIMDAIIMDMKLSPETTLYLIGASRTMVLLALPLSPAEPKLS